MCRILSVMLLVAAGLPRVGCRFPQPQGAQYIASRIRRHSKTFAHGPSSLTPRDKNGLRVINHCLLKRGHGATVGGLGRCGANVIEGIVNRCAAEPSGVERSFGVPPLIGSEQCWSADTFDECSLESFVPQRIDDPVHRCLLDRHVYAHSIEL